MNRKWKRTAVLAVAALLGCVVPMRTMVAAEEDVEIRAAAVSDNDTELDAPEIVMTRGGGNRTCGLGGAVTFEYTNNRGTLFEVSVNPNGREVELSYALDSVTDMEAEAKTEGQMNSLGWGKISSPPMSIVPVQDGCYVVYAKAQAGTQTFYARSNGIVVDTVKPVIKGVEEGKTYPAGTVFQVEDANLDYVLVNEVPAVADGGNYKVAANGNSTSCVIRAKDKAGNETVYSIGVTGTETPKPEEPKPEEQEPPKTDNVISQSKEYTLKAGVKYHLAEGKWKVDGDKSVYQGGSDFYVTADGTYRFKK